MSGEHAKFSPSGAHRWMECVGSLTMERDFPNTSSKYADEGTAAHFLGSLCLENGKNARDYLGREIEVMDGQCRFGTLDEAEDPLFRTPTTFNVDESFADNVQVYLQYVRDCAKGRDLYVEQRLDISKSIGIPDQFGTGDALIVDTERRHLTVVDLKFGMGEQVWSEKNHQMQLYALGAIETLSLIYGEDAFDNVTVVVCQPRLDHIDEWTISIAELMEFAKDAKTSAIVCTGIMRDYTPATLVQKWTPEDPYLSPGEKTCRWCKAKAACPAYAAAVSALVTEDFGAIDAGHIPALPETKQSVASAEVIGRRYGAVEFVSNWVKAVVADAERRVFAKETVIGTDGLPLKIVSGRPGNRKWTDAKVVEGLLAGHVGPDDLYYPREILSVPDAEKKIGKAKFKKLVASGEGVVPGPLAGYVEQAPGKPTIALGSDPRAALDSIAPAATEDEFGAVVDPLLAD
jgi:hypothetical protein